MVRMSCVDAATRTLCAELGSLKLRTLDISHNQLKDLPLSMRHVTTLVTLALDSNPFEDAALLAVCATCAGVNPSSSPRPGMQAW